MPGSRLVKFNEVVLIVPVGVDDGVGGVFVEDKIYSYPFAGAENGAVKLTVAEVASKFDVTKVDGDIQEALNPSLVNGLKLLAVAPTDAGNAEAFVAFFKPPTMQLLSAFPQVLSK